MSDLGNEIQEALQAFPNGDEARFFERGIKIQTVFNHQESEVLFDFPLIGCPHIATPDAALDIEVVSFRNFNVTPLVNEALKDRIGLMPTAGGTPMVVSFTGPIEKPDPNGGFIYRMAATASLQERTLYDVAIRDNSGSWHVVAYNAVYYRSSWHDFGIAHITDMHVAYRIDKFREQLEQLGMPDAARGMYNWNDRFRGFVRYANYLHGIGVLDVILATGDLYDYIYDPYGDGNTNIDLLRFLILGQSRSPEFQDVERLLVPIFMVPGNHDFRKNPYDLIFDLLIPEDLLEKLAAIALLTGGPLRALGTWWFGSRWHKRIPNYQGYNMTWRTAQALTALQNNGNGDDFIEREPDDAGRFVEIEPNPPVANLIKRGSIVINLGDHRIVMLDSSHDIGVAEDFWDLLLIQFLEREEDKETFVGGSPNCVGVLPGDVSLVTRILKEMNEVSPNGLFILGLHAPLVNIREDSNAYFFRESQRPAQTEQVESFLAHRAPVSVSNYSERHSIIRGAFPEWFPINGDQNEPTLLKRGIRDSLLRWGVSHGESEDSLMRVLAGVDAPYRKADVVLAGHTHCHNEFRIAVDPASAEPTFYTDFYTFNPRAYYPTRFYSGWSQTSANPPNYVPGTEVTYVEITDEAERNVAPWPMPYEATHKFNLRVPGYYNPLSHTNDPRAWWNEHRPLLLQTGALGPMKNNQVDFAGFRLLVIKNDVIEKIHFVSSELLERNNYRLPWEQAIAEIPDRRYKYIERSRYFNIPGGVGSPAAIALASGDTKTVYRDGNGILWELLMHPNGAVDHRNLTETAQAARASSDASIFLHHQTQTPIALHRGDDGHVHSIYWTPDGIGSDRLSVSAGSPEAASSTVPTGHYNPATDTTMVFYRDTNDNIQSLYWIGDDAVQSDGAYINTGPNEGAGWPMAKGSPSSYLDKNQTHLIVYRGDDDRIHSLYWRDDTSVGNDNLSAAAGAPTAAGDPVGYYIFGDRFSNHVHYRSTENDLILLWWVDENDPAHYVDLTAWARSPKAASDSFPYYDPATNTVHVIYYAADGHIHEIWWTHQPVVNDLQDVDITVEALAPPAAQARPYAYVTQNPTRQHVIYKGRDNQIHEIHWP